MKSILRRYGFHVLMFLCIYFIAFFVIEIAQMYERTQHVGSQSVDALSNTSIQFALNPESGWDFSFLDDVKHDYALLQRGGHWGRCFWTSDVSLPALLLFPIVIFLRMCYNHLKQKV